MRLILLFTSIFALGLVPVSGTASPGAADLVQIEDAWVRAVPPVTSTTAGYLTLHNSGNQEYLLVGVSSPAVDSVELHMHTHTDGLMRMRRIPHVHLPPGKTVALKPGGMHLMMFHLHRPTRANDVVELTLEFSDGSTKTIDAEVR